MSRFEKTGHFDPWYMLREQAEAEVLVRRQVEKDSLPPLKLTAATREEFHRRVRQSQEGIEEETEQWLRESASEWDRYCCEKMLELYDEAFWMGETGQFADGRPRAEQCDWKVWLLGIIRVGMKNRENGAGGKDDPDGKPDYQEMTPEELDAWLAKQR